MDLSARPIQNPIVLARKIVDGEMVLVNADNAASIALTNQTALTVWELADGKNTVQDIVDGIQFKFQGVPDTISSDVLTFIELLASDGFIGFEWQEQL